MLSPTGGGGEPLALRRLSETPRELYAPAGGHRWGCGLLSHPTGPLRLGVGALSLARIGCRLRPPPRAPRSPGEVASWRAGCGAAAPRSAAGSPRLLQPCTELPGGAPLFSPWQLRLAPPYYLFPWLSRHHPELRNFDLRVWPPLPAPRPPAPSLLCCAMRVGFPI